MKKKIFLIIAICLLMVVGCKEKNDYNNQKWEEETFFKEVAVPKGEVSKFNQDLNEDGKQNYSVFVNDFSYEKFYEYIMALEKDGFHYEFVDESVPEDINKLSDKTETSWRANKGNVYIIANWRSKDNTYYTGYNLQLLFYNYDYTK